MTWNEVAKKILEMTDEQRNTDATFYDPAFDEFHPIIGLEFADDTQSVLDVGHPYLTREDDNDFGTTG